MDSINKINSDDGAAEKLVGEVGGGNGAGSDQKIEIKYMADSQNGETKIDIENLRSAFVGMGKEELMKYANDPFWVKMRWFLFILFWLLWFGMLSGAIAIIVLAPKCAAPTPKEWYEQNPIYEINSRDSSNADSIIDLAGMKENIEYFEELGVKTILLDSVLKSKKDNPNFVEDFMSVDPTLGTGDDFKKFLAMLKEKGIRLLMSLVPNYSSDTHMWFEKSVAKEEPYKDYYIWVPAKGKGTDGQPLPPNNWVSVNGGSAWEWNNARGEFYLHQFDKSQPDLNFRNQALIDYFKDVFKYWLDMGVSGFYLDRVEYLIEDASFKNEPINPDTGATHDQYEFYIHKQTTDLPETVHLLKDWGSFVRNHSGIMAMSWLSREDVSGIAQLVRRPMIVPADVNATKLEAFISKRITQSSSPVWEWSCDERKSCIDDELAKSLKLTLLLLPGTTVIKSGEELGTLTSSGAPSPFADSKVLEAVKNGSSHEYNSYKALIAARETPSVMHGSTQTFVPHNSTIFAYSRIKFGNPGYLVALNMGEDEMTVNLQHLKGVPDEVTVVARSFPVNNTSPQRGKSHSSSSISIPGKGSLVLCFVPKKDDA